jgi:hypothetical protein
MQTYNYLPAAPLSHFIDIIWFSQAGEFQYANLTLPMLHQEMIINFSTQFIVSKAEQIEFDRHSDKQSPVLKMQRPQPALVNNEAGWISGLQTRPIQTCTAGKHFTVGVLFKPWGLQVLTGIDTVELKDSSVSLETVFGKEATELINKIYEQKTTKATFSVLEKFLLDKLSGRSIPDFLLKSLDYMKQATPEDSMIQHIARELSVSPKSFIGAFKKYIGLTPGKFHHLLLLNQTLQHLSQHPTQPLTASTYLLHFFDQAHFIHFLKNIPVSHLRLTSGN